MQLKHSFAVLAAAGAVAATGAAAPAASAAAFVDHGRGTFDCVADPGDVPGLPGFGIANSIVVVSADGGLHVTCYGSLPGGLSVPQTFQGGVICHGEDVWADAPGHIVVTRAGQVTITCRFPAPTV